jgi:hypothetical protein
MNTALAERGPGVYFLLSFAFSLTFEVSTFLGFM